jgi:hypothetical protein
MNQKTTIKSAFIALCIIGMLVFPAAAAPAGQGTSSKVSAFDQGLKDDIWENHKQYRMQIFDLNVQRATSVIGILNKYGIDTTSCQATLTTISGKRSELDTALTARDQEKLKTVNAGLRTLWQQFRTAVKDAVKGHYGKGSAGSSTALTSSGLALAGV